jgi:hypothetical protein
MTNGGNHGAADNAGPERRGGIDDAFQTIEGELPGWRAFREQSRGMFAVGQGGTAGALQTKIGNASSKGTKMVVVRFEYRYFNAIETDSFYMLDLRQMIVGNVPGQAQKIYSYFHGFLTSNRSHFAAS